MWPSILVLAQTRLDMRTPSYMRSSGTPGGSEATLGWWLIAVSLAVIVVMAVLVLWASLRNRGADSDPNNAASIDRGRGRTEWHIASGVNWIYIGSAITIVILIVAFGGTLAVISSASHAPTKPPITLNITAHQWWWEVQVNDSVPSNTFETANEIHVPVGVPVRVRLQSADVIHSFWVPELAGKMDVIPGQVNEMWLRADHVGIYRGQCAEFCGLQHAHMALAVIAQSPADYAAWAGQQRSAGVAPAPNTVASAGKQVFVASCGACHAVQGTDALGRLGPDLTHLASRLTIAAGLVDNTTPNLVQWVHNAQSMKPGVLMPKMDIPMSDVKSVVAYLQTLR